MKIEHTSSPNSEDIEFLAQKIDEETSNHEIATPFAFFIRDDSGLIIAGCSGETMFKVIHTNQLWVNPNYRKQGLGKKLMEHVHAHGLHMGCHMATVLTMSFQNARIFYENIGYKCDLERAGYDIKSSCFFLRRLL